MRFLPNSEEIQQAIWNLEPSRLAVAYIGRDYDRFIKHEWIKQIILSPTRGSNPHAIQQLVDAEPIGWNRIQFIPRLHAKIYLGDAAAVVGSANLSKNGLGVEGLWETGIYVDEPAALDQIGLTFDLMLDQAQHDYPTPEIKEATLSALKEVWVPSTFPPRRALRPIPDNPGNSTLDGILKTVGVIPEYHSRPPGAHNTLAETPLGRTTWEYLNAYQTIDLLIDASDSSNPAVAGIDQQYNALFHQMRLESGEHDDPIRRMVGNMVRQVIEPRGFRRDHQNVPVNGVFFQSGSTYVREPGEL